MTHYIRCVAAAAAMFACAAAAADSDPLAGIAIQADLQTAYMREDYKHWVDADGDGQDARQEALIAESLIDPALSAGGESVTAGLWVGAYTGRVFRDPGDLDIDHMVPLKEAHVSGTADWTEQKKEDYANDLSDADHLIAVWDSANQSKGSRDPAGWMPPNRSYWCDYLGAWIAVKRKWSLAMDPEEADAVREGLKVCGGYAKSDKIGGHQ